MNTLRLPMNTVRFRPLSDQTRVFTAGTADDFTTITRAFRTSELSSQHLPALRAMAAAANQPFYDDVANAIEKHGPIELWVHHEGGEKAND